MFVCLFVGVGSIWHLMFDVRGTEWNHMMWQHVTKQDDVITNKEA